MRFIPPPERCEIINKGNILLAAAVLYGKRLVTSSPITDDLMILAGYAG